MTFGEKLSRLRRENNHTQEQLADILGVSRQAISKWESDLAYPETEKLIRIGKLYCCSMDYLLNDEAEDSDNGENGFEVNRPLSRVTRERKSEKTFLGMPLWHIGKNARGVIAIGLNAKGIIAIGLKARGIISVGLLSLGLMPFGLFALGLWSLGLFSIGVLSMGCISLGILSFGAISFGIVSVGALAIGDFSVGALAVGKYAAYGDWAKGAVAMGGSNAEGTVFQATNVKPEDISYIMGIVEEHTPGWLKWAKNIMEYLIS